MIAVCKLGGYESKSEYAYACDVRLKHEWVEVCTFLSWIKCTFVQISFLELKSALFCIQLEEIKATVPKMTQMNLICTKCLRLSFPSHVNHCSTNLHRFTQASVVQSLIGNVWVCVTIFSASRSDWASARAHDGMSGCLLAGATGRFWHRVARAVHLTLPHRQQLRKRKEKKKEKTRCCVTESLI